MGNLAIVHVETNDVSKPAGDRARSLGDDDIRELKRAEIERQAIDHQRVEDETGLGNIGTHKKVTLSETQAVDPTKYDDCGYLYIKTVNAIKELFWEDSAGNVKQLTSGGKLSVSAADMAAILANIDIGDYEFRAQTLQADVATGTAPMIVASTTKVTNLNADQLDGVDSTSTDLKPLGASVDKSASYGAQVAATDGTVEGYLTLTVGGAGEGHANLDAYTDSAADPTTIKQSIVFYEDGSHEYVGQAFGASFSMTVKKGEYWKVVVSGHGTVKVFWRPLGS